MPLDVLNTILPPTFAECEDSSLWSTVPTSRIVPRPPVRVVSSPGFTLI
jgi:hypothetical protein